MAVKHGYEIDPNQELVAQGGSCGVAGLVGGFPVDGSLSKTSVADSAGQKTQMASLINAGFVLLTLLFLAGVFEKLPAATLGAVVIDAMVGLLSFTEMKRYYRVNRPDFVFFAAAMAGILFFGIIAGIVIGVVLSLLLLIARSSQTSVRRLGRDPGSGAYHELRNVPALETTPGILVVRIDGPLFFADADRFRTRVNELVGQDGATTGVVIDAESVYLTDTDGADIVSQVTGELQARGIALALANVHPATLELWRRAGAIDTTARAGTFGTVSDAVEALSAASADSPVADDAATAGRT
jgi:sulfate permease, SulP family